jgi:DNA-binding HxlR family transcriptional regulator
MRELEIISQVMNFLGERWAVAILLIIFLQHVVRFNEIKKYLGVTSRTLSRKLNILAAFGLIRKEEGDERRNRPFYMLTDLGEKVCSYLVKIKSALG